MSRKHFSYLLALTIITAVLAALLVPQRTGDDTDVAIGPLFPSASDWINDVSEVRITSDGSKVTLKRGAEQWQVAELEEYPADWERLRVLLADLAQAEIIELKTENPEYHSRLGVEDPEMPGASGVLLELVAAGEEFSLVVGNDASIRAGQYVRVADSARSLLIDRELGAPRSPVEWALRDIIDVASGDVAEVEIIHPNGDWVLAAKTAAAETDFTLKSLPEGREISSSWSVNALGGALSALRMDDVAPAADTMPEDVVRFRLLTFAGIEYTLQAWEDDTGPWIRAEASVPAAAAADAVEPEAGESDMVSPKEEADSFNRRVAGWQFQIPEYTFETLTQRSESLLQPLDDDQSATGE